MTVGMIRGLRQQSAALLENAIQLGDFAAAEEAVVQTLWVRLIEGVDKVVNVMAQAQSLKAKGIDISFLEPKLTAVAKQGQNLLDAVVKLITANASLQNVIDSIAGTAAAAAPWLAVFPLHEGFGEVRIGAWREFVASLARPQQAGLGNLWVGLATVLTKPALWTYARPVLLSLITWVGADVALGYIEDVVNGSDALITAQTNQLKECLDRLEKAKPGEHDKIKELCLGLHSQPATSWWLWTTLGVAAGVGALLYWQRKTETRTLLLPRTQQAVALGRLLR